jgi:hypothetical protein
VDERPNENRYPLHSVLREMQVSIAVTFVERCLARLEHDPEKWVPVFGKDHAPTKQQSGMMVRRKIILL